MITNKHYKIITVSYVDSGYFYFENTSSQAGYLYPRIHRGMDSSIAPNCEYSLNGVDWTSIDFNAWPYHVGPNEDGGAQTGNLPGILVNPGARIYLRGTNQNWNPADWGGAGFRMSVPHILGGNLLSLIDYNNMDSITTIPKFGEGAYYGPFAYDTNLISAEKMHFGNATTASYQCFLSMFYGCTNLVKGPDMSTLTTIGNDACRQMFEGCTSLTETPDLSNVVTIDQNGCASMFGDCKALNSGTEFNSLTTVGQNGLSRCFHDINITIPPKFPVLTTVGSSGMSSMCWENDNLTEAPDIRTVTSASNYAFDGWCARSENIATLYAPNLSSWDENVMSNWAGEIAASGTVYAPTGVTIPTDSNSGIPTGWTRVDY